MNEITLVALSSPGCHYCAEFLAFWQVEKERWPNVVFQEVSLMSPQAREYLVKHKVLASPGIIINDELFSVGPVDKEAFVARLTQLSNTNKQ